MPRTFLGSAAIVGVGVLYVWPRTSRLLPRWPWESERGDTSAVAASITTTVGKGQLSGARSSEQERAGPTHWATTSPLPRGWGWGRASLAPQPTESFQCGMEGTRTRTQNACLVTSPVTLLQATDAHSLKKQTELRGL